MSYISIGETTELIARKGYSGLGAIIAVAPGDKSAPYAYKDDRAVGGKLTCINTENGQQVSLDICKKYKNPPAAPTTAEKFTSGMLSIMSPSSTATPGTLPSSGGMPSWVLPVAVGAGALVLVMTLKKK